MDNIDYLSTEYAVIDHQTGDIRFEHAGDKLCLINTEVIMLRKGDLIFEGRVDDLKKSEDPYIRRFIRGQ